MRRRFMSNKITPININNYLTIEAKKNGLRVCLSTNACEYCIDGDGNWKSLLPDTYTEFIDIGQTLSFRGKLLPDSSNGIGTFTISEECNLLGNCMSLLFGDNAANNYSLFGRNWAFSALFKNCNYIISVSENFLPATTMATNCYNSMFYGCTSLTTAPALPATTMATNCYNSMFYGCTSLTTAPALPATTLAEYCYYNMFYGCAGLTSVPALPATTLASWCYHSMFNGCNSLTTVPALPATTLADSCYYDMFYNCTNLTTAPELPATTLASRCYYNMFYNCTNLTTAPSILPATTLAVICYNGMFYNCTSLTTAPELPATTLASSCYDHMFYNCSKLNYIKMLATNISASNCLSNWVYRVSSTGTFVKNPAMTSLPRGDSGIPSGWTVVNDGEEGDKVVNKVQLVDDGMEWILMFDYPTNSDLKVTVGDNQIPIVKGTQQSSTGYPSFDKPTIIGIDPLEDDKYIYTW